MNNDLISRSELREKVFFNDYSPQVVDENAQRILTKVLQFIDNAPAVEYPFYQEAYQTGYEEGQNAIPQGEWVGDGFVFCNQCGCSHGTHKTNYCPNCGASMWQKELKALKGGAEND